MKKHPGVDTQRGIFGFWLNRELNNHDIKLGKSGTQKLNYRGPDNLGYYKDDKKGLFFGHTRFAKSVLFPEGLRPGSALCALRGLVARDLSTGVGRLSARKNIVFLQFDTSDLQYFDNGQGCSNVAKCVLMLCIIEDFHKRIPCCKGLEMFGI